MPETGEFSEVIQLDPLWLKHTRVIRSLCTALNAPSSQTLTANTLAFKESRLIVQYDRFYPVCLSLLSVAEMVQADKYLQKWYFAASDNQAVLFKAFQMKLEGIFKEGKKEKYNSEFYEYKDFFDMLYSVVHEFAIYAQKGHSYPDPYASLVYAFIECLIESGITPQEVRGPLHRSFKNQLSLIEAIFTQKANSAQQALFRVAW